MCLDKVTKLYDPPQAKERVAWKVFRKDGEDLWPECRHEDKPHLKGKWMRSGRGWISTVNGDYPNGFHCFERKEDAEAWRMDASFQQDLIVMKVRVRKVVGRGMQEIESFGSFRRCILAREMKIPKD